MSTGKELLGFKADPQLRADVKALAEEKAGGNKSKILEMFVRWGLAHYDEIVAAGAKPSRDLAAEIDDLRKQLDRHTLIIMRVSETGILPPE